MIRYLTPFGVLGALSACTSVEALRPDMHAHAVPSRADEIAMINQLNSAIYVYTPTASQTCINGAGLKPFRPKFVQGYADYQESSGAFAGCVAYKDLTDLSDTDRDSKIRAYLDSGFGLVDLYCSRFFMVAAETRQSRQIQRNSASALDVLATTVATASGLGTSGLNIINGGFELADSTYKNIDSAFVIAPDRDDLLALVSASQDKIRTDSYAIDYQSYAGARSSIDRYAQACTFDGMRNLVGVAVRNAAKDAKGDEETNQPGTDRDLLGTATPG